MSFKVSTVAVVTILALLLAISDAFTLHHRKVRSKLVVGKGLGKYHTWKRILDHHHQQRQCRYPNSIQRYMYNNLPPPNNNNNNNDNGLGSILRGLLSIVSVVAFFASPLGSIFFALANTLLGVIVLSPLLLFVGFQVWKFFNTYTAPCPNCGATQRVNKDMTPSICVSCGTFIQANPDGKKIDLVGQVNGSSDYYENYNLFNNPMGNSNSILDDLFQTKQQQPDQQGSTKSQSAPKKFQEQTIIDAEIEDEDKK
mmetsp:Transcript_25852/g.43965  ORF Transcript_25852/g.43965 Transcript_25852/m.43965 type:complete len:255 (+) Transcript_25852:1-765(+)